MPRRPAPTAGRAQFWHAPPARTDELHQHTALATPRALQPKNARVHLPTFRLHAARIDLSALASATIIPCHDTLMTALDLPSTVNVAEHPPSPGSGRAGGKLFTGRAAGEIALHRVAGQQDKRTPGA